MLNQTFVDQIKAQGFVETYYRHHETADRDLAFYTKTTVASAHPSLATWISQDCVDADAVVVTEVCPDGRIQRVIKEHNDAFFMYATPVNTDPGLTALAEAMAAEAVK